MEQKLLPENAGPSIYISTVELGKIKLQVTEEIDLLNKELRSLEREIFNKKEYLRRLSDNPYWCFQCELDTRIKNYFRGIRNGS